MRAMSTSVRVLVLVPLAWLALACPAVADEPAATAAAALPAPAAKTPTISATALEARLAQSGTDLTLLDVRTAEEFAAGHVPGARNIPVAELEARLGELTAAKNHDVVVYCRTGRRAAAALQILAANGFQHLLHLEGDMQGWADGGHRVEVPAREPAPAP